MRQSRQHTPPTDNLLTTLDPTLIHRLLAALHGICGVATGTSTAECLGSGAEVLEAAAWESSDPPDAPKHQCKQVQGRCCPCGRVLL